MGLVLITPKGATIEKSLRLGFSATNNEAEYEALLQGMAMVQKMGGKAVEMFSDSRLVVGQVTGEMEAKDVRMQEYLNQVKHLRLGFDLFSLSHIARSGNTHADSLATLATSSAGHLPWIILVEHLGGASKVAKNTTRVHETRVDPSWMDPIVAFLKDDIMPEAKSKAEKIRRKATRFWLSEDHKLYRRSYSGPYLLCVHLEASELLLEELHEGICGSHTGGRSCHTEPLPRVTSGRGCKRKLWSMFGNVTNARSLPRASINQAESSTLCPAHSHSPSEAWTL